MAGKSRTPWQKISFIQNFDDGQITSTEKFVLFILTLHLGKNEFCFPSLTTLMRECCLARDKICNNIKKLIKRGYLRKLPPGDGFRSNRYVVDFEVMASSEGLLVAKGYHTSSERLPEGLRKATRLVAKGYPNRNIKEKEKKDKREEPFFSLEDQKQEQQQKPIKNGVMKKEIALSKLGLKHPGKSRAELESIYNEQTLTKH